MVNYNLEEIETKIKMEPLNDFDRDCLMTIDEFKKCCEYGVFTGDDGIGYYATDSEISNINAFPSAFINGNIRTDFTHICWYNK